MNRRNIETDFNQMPRQMRNDIQREFKLESMEKVKAKYEELLEDLASTIQRHFPKYLDEFKPPAFERLYGSFCESGGGYSGADKIDSRAFFAAAAVRYIDNFIDEVFWKKIRKLPNSKELRYEFEAFLIDALVVCRKYDPAMPRTIIELPLLEFDVETTPTQEMFDASIEKLIKYKSYDIQYISNILAGSGANMIDINDPDMIVMGLVDFLRDWESKSTAEDDFNIRKHVVKHGLNLDKLKELVEKYTREDDEYGDPQNQIYEKASKVIFQTGVEIERENKRRGKYS